MKTLVEYCKEQFTFKYFAHDTLYYTASDGFRCRIPVKDLDGSMVKATEKGSVFMKWIRVELIPLGNLK